MNYLSKKIFTVIAIACLILAIFLCFTCSPQVNKNDSKEKSEASEKTFKEVMNNVNSNFDTLSKGIEEKNAAKVKTAAQNLIDLFKKINDFDPPKGGDKAKFQEIHNMIIADLEKIKKDMSDENFSNIGEIVKNVLKNVTEGHKIFKDRKWKEFNNWFKF